MRCRIYRAPNRQRGALLNNACRTCERCTPIDRRRLSAERAMAVDRAAAGGGLRGPAPIRSIDATPTLPRRGPRGRHRHRHRRVLRLGAAARARARHRRGGPPATTPSDATAARRSRPSEPARPASRSQIEIPAIGVRAPVIKLGLNRDGSLEVPRRFGDTGWWSGGSRPGEPGAGGDRRPRRLAHAGRRSSTGSASSGAATASACSRRDGTPPRLRSPAPRAPPEGALPDRRGVRAHAWAGAAAGHVQRRRSTARPATTSTTRSCSPLPSGGR